LAIILITSSYTAKRKNIKLIATKIETKNQYLKAIKYDFDFFQGFYFSNPTMIAVEDNAYNKEVIVKLLKAIKKEEEINKLEEYFKFSPQLVLALIRFINSPIFAFKERIKTIRHAISLLGYKKLEKWLIFLLLNSTLQKRQYYLFEIASLRGKIMEELSKKTNLLKEKVDDAFIVGILSILSLSNELEKENLINIFGEEIKEAVLKKEGILGLLLLSIEELERKDFNKVEKILKKLNLSLDDIISAELEAFSWLETLKKEMISLEI